MKVRTIRSVLRKKFDEWAESIEDPQVRSLVQNNGMITGGCIASMLLQEKVNDYDVYFTDLKTVEEVTNYYLKKFKENPPPRMSGSDVKIWYEVEDGRVRIVVKSAGVAGEGGDGGDYQYFEGLEDGQDLEVQEYVERVMGPQDEEVQDETTPRYRPVFLSSNAITLSDKIQITIRFYGSPEEIHRNYDFVHCTGYWVAKTGQLEVGKEALECMLTRELRYQGSLYPLCSVIRTRKFLKRNWTINAGQYLKMLLQLNELDLLDPVVLEDQLVGVDVAYFQELLDKVASTSPEKVNTAYIVEIIDRMF